MSAHKQWTNSKSIIIGTHPAQLRSKLEDHRDHQRIRLRDRSSSLTRRTRSTPTSRIRVKKNVTRRDELRSPRERTTSRSTRDQGMETLPRRPKIHYHHRPPVVKIPEHAADADKTTSRMGRA